MSNKARSLGLAILFPIIIAACGFQLRGEQTLPFAKLFVSGNTSYATVVQIKQRVATVPRTKLAEKSEEADGTLQILSEEREKFILSLNAAGRVREYDLRLRVSYRLSDGKGNDLIPTNEILLTRVLPYDETQVLAKGEEEVLLYRDMQNDVVGQIMRRVAAVKPKS